MDGFDPTSSFGPDVAARYDDHLRGDEDAAALRLVERWGGFGREPFTARSAAHVSVYARAH
jgi:hypothetical protein